MQKFVVGENIRRYRQMLESENDDERRSLIERLLAEETEIWAGLLDPADVDHIDEAQEQSTKRQSK